MYVCVCVMGKTVLKKCKEMLRDNIKQDIINLQTLRHKTLIYVGGDERTILQAMRIMLDVGLIEDVGNSRFKIIRKKENA